MAVVHLLADAVEHHLLAKDEEKVVVHLLAKAKEKAVVHLLAKAEAKEEAIVHLLDKAEVYLLRPRRTAVVHVSLPSRSEGRLTCFC